MLEPSRSLPHSSPKRLALWLVLFFLAFCSVSANGLGAAPRPGIGKPSKPAARKKGAAAAKARASGIRKQASGRLTLTGYYGHNFDEAFEIAVQAQPQTLAYAFRYRSDGSSTATSFQITAHLPAGATALEAYYYGTGGRLGDVAMEGVGGSSPILKPTQVDTGNRWVIVTFTYPHTLASPGPASADLSWDAEVKWADNVTDVLDGSSSLPVQAVSNLTVNHTVNGGSGNKALPGSTINYTVTMNSRLPASQYQLTVVLAPGLEVIPGNPPGGTLVGNFLTWNTGSGTTLGAQFSLRVKSADQLPQGVTRFEISVSAAAQRTHTFSGLGKPYSVDLAFDRVKVTVGATHPEEVGPDTLIRFTTEVKVESSTPLGNGPLVVTAQIPNDSLLQRSTVSPKARITARQIEWTFTNGEPTVNVAFSVKVVPRAKLPKTTEAITAQVSARATLEDSTVVEGSGSHPVLITEGEVAVQSIDASLLVFPDLFLPAKGATSYLAKRSYVTNTRLVTKVATDGVSLLLLRVPVVSKKAARVKFELKDTESLGAPLGGVFTVDDLSLADTTVKGGTRDKGGDGAAKVTVPLVANGTDRYAFALYRSPRNFDTGDAAATGGRQNRPLRVRVVALDKKNKELRAEAEQSLTLVRPLVILQHGTFDSPDGWRQFPLWRRSGNELNNSYSGATAEFPFHVGRTSFEFISRAAGPAMDSARAAQIDLERALADWRFRTESAGAQADVICHSYGGVIMRLIAQGAVTGDPNPLSPEVNTYRNARNWGHGSIHKLITIATTHRGSSTGNHLAVLNQNGALPGLVRRVAADSGQAIDTGAVADQMVLSPLLQFLKETPVPCHAVVGSGLVQYNRFYEERIYTIWRADRGSGPYKAVGPLYDPNTGSPRYDVFRRLTNFGWNMAYDTLTDDTLQNPNYDLTVSSYSQKGRLPRRAYSDHTDLEKMAGLTSGALLGRLTHGDEIGAGSGNTVPTEAVAKRVAWLLRQPTTSQVFARFPDAMAQPPTPTEKYYSEFSRFNPSWLNRTLTGGSTGSVSSQGEEPVPVLTQVSGSNPVQPGGQFQVAVTWPGKSIEIAYVTWTSGVAMEQHMVEATGVQNTVTIQLHPDHRPGRLVVGAVVKATDGTVREAKLVLAAEIEATYTRLRMMPNVLRLRSVYPQAFGVYGRLANGESKDLSRSTRLTLSSANPSVVRITEDGLIEAVGIGTAEVTASVAGAPSDSVNVNVDGLEVKVGMVPLGAPARLTATSETPVQFVILSDTLFDARRVDPQSVRINGKSGAVVTFKDVNGDRKLDAVAAIKPVLLGLAPGNRVVPILAGTTGGTLVAGSLTVAVQ